MRKLSTTVGTRKTASMAKKVTTKQAQPPVVVAVFDDFIQHLESDRTIDTAVVTRLKKVLLHDQETSADSLRTALFSEESLP